MNNSLSSTAWRSFCRTGFCLLMAFVLVSVAGNAAVQARDERSVETLPSSEASDAPLCRFGVNAIEDPADVDLASLRVGWYMNFRADANPSRPGGIEYMPTIRISPDNSPAGYTYGPSGAQLQNVIATSPGARWLIGNEPDSLFQDNVTPEVYARAYHELFYLIKAADPAAQIIAGSIVQATEIRLLYLDMVLNSYHEQFDEPLPADGWSIHNYILNEVNASEVDCGVTPCWGADIPAGIDRIVGERWDLKDNDRDDVFIERIVRFREWLADHGYRGDPLYLTEYGILPPADYVDENGEDFGPERVNAFMDETYQYLLTAADPYYGNPNDGYRLVQKWSWYSTSFMEYNGALFDPITYQRTAIGDFFASFTDGIDDEVDFYPHQIGAVPPTPFSQGEPVTLTLRATVANSGNLVESATATVRFYDAHPDQGGVQIGSDQVVNLTGCGDHQQVSVPWTNIPPGVHDVYVEVTSSAETATVTDNNIGSGRVLVGTHRTVLPVTARGLPSVGE